MCENVHLEGHSSLNEKSGRVILQYPRVFTSADVSYSNILRPVILLSSLTNIIVQTLKAAIPSVSNPPKAMDWQFPVRLS